MISLYSSFSAKKVFFKFGCKNPSPYNWCLSLRWDWHEYVCTLPAVLSWHGAAEARLATTKVHILLWSTYRKKKLIIYKVMHREISYTLLIFIIMIMLVVYDCVDHDLRGSSAPANSDGVMLGGSGQRKIFFFVHYPLVMRNFHKVKGDSWWVNGGEWDWNLWKKSHSTQMSERFPNRGGARSYHDTAEMAPDNLAWASWLLSLELFFRTALHWDHQHRVFKTKFGLVSVTVFFWWEWPGGCGIKKTTP